MDSLLNFGDYILHNGDIPWDVVTPTNMLSAIPTLIERGYSGLATISALPADKRTYETTFGAFERHRSSVAEVYGLLSHVCNVNSTPELREAKSTLEPQVSKFLTDAYLDHGVFEVLRGFNDSPAASSLSHIQRRHIEETLEDFREQGAYLNEADRTEFKALQVKLSELGTSFRCKNQEGQRKAYILVKDDVSETAGIPDFALENARREARELKLEEDKLVFYSRYTDSSNVMRFCSVEKTREAMWRCSQSVCSEAVEGMPNVTDEVFGLLKARQRTATLMGKACWGDYILARRMVGSADAAMAFEDRLRDIFSPYYEREMNKLAEEKRALYTKSDKNIAESATLQPWDTAYLTRLLTEKEANFDENDMRDYFELENFLGGMFALFGRLYGIKIVEDLSDNYRTYLGTAAESRNQGVRKYVISEGEENGSAKLATVYLDLFVRHTKDQGAWFDDISFDETLSGHTFAVVVTNFSQPVADKEANGKKVTKLSCRDAETLLHEWGHAMHGILSRVTCKALAATNVQWDAVELPSQLNENWLYQRESLDLLAKHYTTGIPVPEDLLAGLRKSRQFLASLGVMRQLSLGKLDLYLHNVLTPEHASEEKWPKTLKDLEEAVKKVLYDEKRPFSYTFEGGLRPNTLIRTFQHLFGSACGYASAYYSYMWAEVLEADVFYSHFKGHLCRKAGEEFRRKFLDCGNTKTADVLFRDLMGRDVDESALLKKYGIEKQ